MAAINQIWQNFLDIVKQEEGSRVVETWLKAVSIERWDSCNCIVYLKAPNHFVREWVRNNYLHLFYEHLGRLFAVDSLEVTFIDHEEQVSCTVVPARLAPQEESSSVPQVKAKKISINKTYLFDTFVVGPSNSLSYAAAYAVTKKPGLVYNPLFVYGGSGLGKTHLLHAIGNAIKEEYKKLSVLYQPADRFVNEFIHAIRFDKIDLFKEKYRTVDVLLIDDIQFIAHKDQTQEAFFHIFNTLYESSKQIVLSSDVYPTEMKGIPERLRSRLGWGLVTDIQKPTIEEKVAILKRKAELSHEPISDEVAHFIAAQSVASIRELEGALIRVFAFASLTNQPVSLDLVKKVLNHSPVSIACRSCTLESIAEAVGKYYSFTLTELRSKLRSKEIALARQIAMYLMKRLTDKSLQDIGQFLKRKDHTTVAHAIGKIQKVQDTNESIKSVLEKLENSLQST
ncbi:TPA: chromosomal replication initiator protein DnaA [Candidatus Dependentiae bacterium]|nr:MAG: Chromosomal replication initiator protein DnaA [candidate division TM6 bacterium GW2011_GWF2_36_131]KKQ03236.1 MAG: Chromosomal replication initiator protein DnaA [candidate division TM6 bacterium GW2011_GWE2_36_25]KKQ19827.1 MAG: Chromosomal replication initiator protein DnaA [candidate division TM6 bacterium GW2011_GWA2_36_9]HBR70335.1 chromosomal replication initiator protein DnaA [Candidatus Dependentiae bacterium]HCU00880.1 chromosomal replication initiator protein DnaA [Candidatus